MDEKNLFKLRIRMSDGQEFEAVGTPEFINDEKSKFLGQMTPNANIQPAIRPFAPLPQTAQPVIPIPEPSKMPYNELGDMWLCLGMENGIPYIRQPGDLPMTDAALLIIKAAGKDMAALALTITNGLRRSGYQPQRLDRMLQDEIKVGRLLADGTKRGRTYKLTELGQARAHMLIQKLSGKLGN